MKTLADRYRLDYAIGAGGMGIVWRARDLRRQQMVAIKEVRLPELMTTAERDRVNREARAAGRVEHPAIVKVHEVVVTDAGPWIVMDLVEGRSLGERVRIDGPLEPATGAKLGLILLDALAAAHAANIIHGDVKPANVILRPDGHPLLTDFAVAATLDSTLPMSDPVFIAPERRQHGEGGPEGDLYSLGATLAFASPEAVPELVAALMAEDPQARPPVEAVRAALSAAAGHDPTSVPATGPEIPGKSDSAHPATPTSPNATDTAPAQAAHAPAAGNAAQATGPAHDGPGENPEAGNAAQATARTHDGPGENPEAGNAAQAVTPAHDGRPDNDTTLEHPAVLLHTAQSAAHAATGPGAAPGMRTPAAPGDTGGTQGAKAAAGPTVPKMRSELKVAALIGAGVLAFLVAIVLLGHGSGGGGTKQAAQGAPAASPTDAALVNAETSPSPTDTLLSPSVSASASTQVGAASTTKPPRTTKPASASPKPGVVTSAKIELNPATYSGPCNGNGFDVSVTVTIATSQPGTKVTYATTGKPAKTVTAANGVYTETYKMRADSSRRYSFPMTLTVTSPGSVTDSLTLTSACTKP